MTRVGPSTDHGAGRGRVDERAGTNALGRNSFNSWDDVDNAFKAWAAQFARRLGELGGCPQ